MNKRKDKEPDLKEILSAFLKVKPEPEIEKKKAKSQRGNKPKKKK